MAELQLDPQKTALVLIDLQNAVLGMTPAPHSADKVVGNSVEARERFPRQGRPSCIRACRFKRFPEASRRSTAQHGRQTPACRRVGDRCFCWLSAQRDILITKRHWAPFAGTDLEQRLKNRRIDTVVLTGISTNVGVESTARQGTGLDLPLCWSKTPAPPRTPNNTATF